MIGPNVMTCRDTGRVLDKRQIERVCSCPPGVCRMAEVWAEQDARRSYDPPVPFRRGALNAALQAQRAAAAVREGAAFAGSPILGTPRDEGDPS